MRKSVLRARRGLLSTALFVSASVFGMAAMAAGPADDVSPSLRQALQRDLGLTPAQVAQYLKIERLARQQEKLQAAAQGRHYAGSWIERQANGDYKFVVASTRAPQKAPVGPSEPKTSSVEMWWKRKAALAGPSSEAW